MSRRGRNKRHEEAGSESENKDETFEEKPAKESDYRLIGARKAFFYSIVIAAVFFGIGFVVNPAITGQSGAQSSGGNILSNIFIFGQSGVQPVDSGSDMFIFISPPGCTNCAEMEPVAKDVANTLGIPFVKTGFAQQMETPGFVLIYEDKFLGATGFDSEYSLKAQVCQMSGNEDICKEATETEAPPPPTPEVPKSDNPEAHAFVMSYCPYGLQFMKAYVPVIELLGEKADLQVNFVHYIMHEEKEATENTRMYCIQKEQREKFTDYLRCFVEDGNYEGCITEVGIDSAKLETCMQAADSEFEITKNLQESTERFPPYMVDAVLAQLYGVGGSPTFGINGQQVQVSRSPEAIKQAICSAFNTPPEECSQTLSSASEAPGFGPMGSGGGSESQAQC